MADYWAVRSVENWGDLRAVQKAASSVDYLDEPKADYWAAGKAERRAASSA